MAKTVNEHRAVVDAFAHLSADITAAPSDADAQRLRSFTASALRAQLRLDTSLQALPPATTRLTQVVPESLHPAPRARPVRRLGLGVAGDPHQQRLCLS
jgi:hypothetical protein